MARSRTWSAYELHTRVPAERWGILMRLQSFKSFSHSIKG